MSLPARRAVRLTPSLVMTCLLLGACGLNDETVSRTEPGLMDTVCTITLYGGGSEADIDAAFARVRQVDGRLTMWQEASEVSAVSRAAGLHPVRVSEDTARAIQVGLELSRMGAGAFDLTVGPLVKLWAIGSPRARVPSPAEITDALGRVGYRDLELSREAGTVYLRRPGMVIDLGAVAKGYAADEAARVLASRGVKHAVVNLGGNIVTVGRKPGGGAWRIGLQSPGKAPGTQLAVLAVGASSVVTSGAYERYFVSGGVRYHHIMDTASGYPTANGLEAVSVVGLPSVYADGLGTLLFTLGLERGRELAEREAARSGMNAVFVTEDRRVYVTRGLRRSFTLVDGGYTLAGW